MINPVKAETSDPCLWGSEIFMKDTHMKTNHTIDFKLYTTNTMDKKAQLDFLSVYNRVFDENEGLDFFARKFREDRKSVV